MDYEELKNKMKQKVRNKYPLVGRDQSELNAAKYTQNQYLTIVELICDTLEEYEKIKSS